MTMLDLLLVVDLYCGLGGWAEGFLAEGYRVRGYDIEAHDYGTGGYPGELILADVLKLHGRDCADATVIVGSSPCTEYSYMAMPWSRSKQIARALRGDGEFPEGYTGSRTIAELNALFDAQFRIQREAIEAAGRYIPLIVENVRGAQPWVGGAKAEFGSFMLWGDIRQVGNKIVRPDYHYGDTRFLITPTPRTRMKFRVDCSPQMWRDRASASAEEAVMSGHLAKSQVKVPGISFSGYGSPDYKPQGFNVTAGQRYREGTKQAGISGPRTNGKGDKWFQDGAAQHGSKSDSRKAASAQIAKIPFPLASYIARVFRGASDSPDPQ